MPNEVKNCDVLWDKLYRLIPSHFPPIDLFEQVVNPEDLDYVFAIESLTNDRLLEEAGNLTLVPADERVSGNGSTPVMAAFTHIGVASRFTDGREYGVYYGADSLKTAVEETKYHRAKFLAATDEPDTELTMRCYINQVALPLHDIRDAQYDDLHTEDYVKPQAFARELRALGSNGLVYRSVRHKGGQCVAAFKPKAVTIPIQGAHYRYVYQRRVQQVAYVFETKPIDGF